MGRTATLILAALFAATGWAHHSWSEYDSSKLLKLSGKVVESGYEHPHGFIRLATQGKTWLCVLAPPSRMESRGLAKEALKPGAAVAVEGYANRSKPEEMRAERITAGGWDVDAMPPMAARACAALSLALWLSVIACGRLLAYT